MQSIPRLSAAQIIKTVKNITAKEIYKRFPEVKEKLWGGQFWSDGYYVSTVGQHGNEKVIQEYVKKQGTEKEYEQLLKQEQLDLFE
ncbi:IS200/IS605 family transposase [Absiella sp. AM54-8XD]|uniref:IS200/IS605 family transposase n=1 Tax=[Eubacterium] hominis TaxID=2764325 RepID=UPI000E40FB28|nr:IS200/IS605 family transposase [Absiella sp. AM22-9]RGB62190.1 IS200/IS605 family transposase [Absiella sp. AM10-20]RGC17188.1 IS200/IS605 family transposase [Absiella sp. AM54-8XD]RHU06632.1 IS200/IS605 family transposase [Absiella sp. AM27-20]